MLQKRSLVQLSVLWTLSMLLFPLLILQGAWLRRTAHRLPDGEPPCDGQVGEGQQLRLVGVGDSVIAGTGIGSMQASITAQIAQSVASRWHCAVSWSARGVNGDRLADLITALEARPIGQAELVVVSIGVNDVTGLTSLLRWQMQLTALLPLLRRSGARQIIVLGVPPMEYFTALPRPLRWVLGVRAAMLDRGLQQLASLVPDVCWVDVAMKFDAQHLAPDGYHPNEQAVSEIAQQVTMNISRETLS